MRTLSQAIKNVLAQDYAETKDVVIITIPEQQGATVYPETTLYFANGEGVVLDGKAYENKLRNIGAIKFSLGKAPDNTDISIENVSRDLGFTLTDFQRVLDGSKVEIKRAFKVSESTWETNVMFVGYVRDTKVSQDKIDLSLTSDMTRRGTSVAGRPLTQRCIFRFNVNGSGVGPLCGWVTSQPGNPLSCDKGLDTVNGCQAHGNQHRFGGVPAFTALDLSNGYDYTSGGWGEGSGGGWCISIDSLVLAAREGKRVWVEAASLRANDFLVSIDPEGRFVPSRIVSVQEGEVEKLLSLTTARGYTLSSSEEHGIMQKYSSADAVAVGTLVVGDEVLVYDFATHTHLKDAIKKISVSTQKSRVLKIQLEAPHHLFMAAENEEGAIVSHNRKPVYTDYERQYQMYQVV